MLRVGQLLHVGWFVITMEDFYVYIESFFRGGDNSNGITRQVAVVLDALSTDGCRHAVGLDVSRNSLLCCFTKYLYVFMNETSSLTWLLYILPIDSDDSERPEFLKHLSSLRSDAPVFLAMLNETRRQVRELRRPNRQDSTIQAYKPVLKDLSRILILLNRREERLGPPPPDWETLLAWGERVLRRYKKHNPNQVAQLVNFLQVPVQTHPSPPSPYPPTLTTFTPTHKPPSHTDSSSTGTPSSPSPNMQQLAISAFDAKYEKREDRSPAVALNQNSLLDSGVDFNPSWEFNPTNYTILAEWTASEPEPSYSEFDDDFFQLGFRPQDEITTEL
ncbi:hypothetical protein J6590_017118 [Homalodisca vitripennis]|nr:hypothetical protein J6590_017118 [Homalodisca vitripennis]